MKIITFELRRFAPGATSLQDVDAFIAQHSSAKDGLVVDINRDGIGDAFADRLEGAGFTVRRFTLKRVYS